MICCMTCGSRFGAEIDEERGEYGAASEHLIHADAESYSPPLLRRLGCARFAFR